MNNQYPWDEIEPSEKEKLDTVLRDEAMKAHLEARQRTDLRRDLVQRLRPSDGPFELGQSVWYWDRDMSKLRGGEWIRTRIVGEENPPMIKIDINGKTIRVNQSKIRKNPDPWHDVVIPGLERRDAVVTVPGTTEPQQQQDIQPEVEQEE